MELSHCFVDQILEVDRLLLTSAIYRRCPSFPNKSSDSLVEQRHSNQQHRSYHQTLSGRKCLHRSAVASIKEDHDTKTHIFKPVGHRWIEENSVGRLAALSDGKFLGGWIESCREYRVVLSNNWTDEIRFNESNQRSSIHRPGYSLISPLICSLFLSTMISHVCRVC